MQAIVLLSGGIDSMACIHFYLNQGYCIEALFCDYGQPASVREMESAKTISKYYKMPLHIIRTTDIKIPKSGEICGRNALLVHQALCFGGYGVYKIILGIHDGTGYADCTQLFVDQMNRVIDCYANGTIILEAPFLKWHKKEIVTYCQENKLPLEITYSCETGRTPPCGCGASCLDRKEFLNEHI